MSQVNLLPPELRRRQRTRQVTLQFVALGAGGATAGVRSLHRSHEFGSLALDAFAFE